MNKDKLIEKINQLPETVFDKDMDWHIPKKEVIEIIQSEPEENKTSLFFECPVCHTKAGIDLSHKEKTNFDVITESSEKLAEFILEVQYDMKNGQEWPTAEACLDYLNQKAGE